MARLVVLFTLCVLPAIVLAASSTQVKKVAEYDLEGRVYCDTCRCGFENSATRYIAGAVVEVVCTYRKNIDRVVYRASGKTDKTGTYIIRIKGDKKDHVCKVKLVSSPMKECNTPDPGRDSSHVSLNSYSGIASNKRYANALGFMHNRIMEGCTQVLKQYQEAED